MGFRFSSSLPYELLQVPHTGAHPQDNVTEVNVTSAKTDHPLSIANAISIVTITETTKPELHVHSSKQLNSSDHLLHTSSMVLLSPSKVTTLETPSLSSITKRSADSQDDVFVSSLVAPAKVFVKDGIAVFKDLFLPPPPLDLNSTTSPGKDQSSSPTNDTPNKKQKTPSQFFPQSNFVVSRTKASTPGRMASKLSDREKILQTKRDKFCAPGRSMMMIMMMGNIHHN